MTNYEKIKAMSVEEMAELLRCFCLNSVCCDDCPLDGICPSACCEFKHTWKNWLESEVDT